MVEEQGEDLAEDVIEDGVDMDRYHHSKVPVLGLVVAEESEGGWLG